MNNQNLVIVGASLAGAKAAEGARDAGFDGRIVVVGDEPALPYERPALSKELLRGEKTTASTLVHPAKFYEDNAIELVEDQATSLDLFSRKVELLDGSPLAFDTAVLATGAQPRRLRIAGAELDGVYFLRTIQDAVRLHDAIKAASRVAVIGAGWIGSEVAASARKLGAPVVLIDPSPTPLHGLLGQQLGAVFAQLHAEHGVELRLGRGVSELRGDRAVHGVVLDDGRVEPADVVVVGIGVEPRTRVAADAVGLRVHYGVLVDQYLRTNVEGVFAAGDVANAWHPFYRRNIRVEHWANALNQGLTAGRNAAGRTETYGRLPYFFSDQYDLGLEYVGHHDPADRLVIRGDLAAREFIAFWHRHGVLTAAMNVNVWDVVDNLKAMVASGAPVDLKRLADIDAPLTP